MKDEIFNPISSTPEDHSKKIITTSSTEDLIVVSQSRSILISTNSTAAPSFFSLNVVNLSFQPGRRLISSAFEFIRNTVNSIPYAEKLIGPKTVQHPHVLHNINFCARGGKITAILGTAAERRELIEIIVGRKKRGTVSGNIFMKGTFLPNTTSYYENVTYVPLKPIFVPGLTYAEILRFSVRLKMSNYSHSPEFVEDRVEDLLNIMDLQKCKHRQIPDRPQTRGEIGCDFRRLVIALEIVTLPNLIVINEPTLDFDPAISVSILQCLKTLTTRGHAVVCSLSHPYKQELLQTDSVVLISEGYSIYSSSPKYVEKYFCNPKVGYILKEGVDLVDFLLDISSGVERPINQRNAELPLIMQSVFESTEFFDPPDYTMSGVEPTEGYLFAFAPEHFLWWGYGIREKPSVFVNRSYVVLVRALTQKIKDTEVLKKLSFAVVMMGCVFGYLDYKQGDYGYFALSLLKLTYLNTANVSSLFFFMVAFQFLFPSANTSAICEKMKLFRYEQAIGCCSIPAFYFSTVISEGLFVTVYGTIFTTIMHYMVKISKGFSNYLFFVGMGVMVMYIGVTTIFLCVSVFRRERMARDVFFLLLIAQIFVSGFCFPVPKLPDKFLFTMSGLSPVRWAFEGLLSWKFSFYADGETFLSTYGFNTFKHYDIFKILGNILLVGNAVFVISLIKEPMRLNIILPTKSKKGNNDEERGERMSSTASEEHVWDSTPSMMARAPSRQSELVKPAIFTRDSSIARVASKLSINVTQTGERNGNRGPTLLFSELNFKVRDRKSPLGYKYIINNVSGQFDWGKLSVIMGAAEAGKSSLIHILAGDVVKGAMITGDILLDGVKPDKNVPLWQRCGLVPAENFHFRDLSVNEILTFAMTLRCVHRDAYAVVKENVNSTIDILHLEDVADKKSKLLSPGQLKRLSIAEEMVHGPKLILLDEPITGVDIQETAVLMSTFREMVNQDRTVVATVQQPSAEVFDLFDSLLLLSKGRVIYFGPVKKAANYFSTGPWQYDITHYTNPADFLADISGGFMKSLTLPGPDSVALEEHYHGTANHLALTERINNAKNNSPDALSAEPTSRSTPSIIFNCLRCFSCDSLIINFWTFRTLFVRSTLSLFKRFQLVMGSNMIFVLLSTVFGWCMGDCVPTSSKGVSNVTAFIAISSVFILLSNLQFIFYLHNNNQVFLRENSRQLYYISSYWIVASLPLYFLRSVNSIFFCLIAYNMAKLDTASGTYGFFILSYILFTICTTMIAEFITYANDESDNSYLALSGMAAIQFVFSGLLIKPGSLPVWMRPFMPSLSLVRWNMQGLTLNIYGGSVGPLTSTGNAFVILPSGYNTFDAFLSLFGWGGKTKWFCLQRIGIYIAVVWTLVYLILVVKAYTFHGGRKSSKNNN